jgi:hypothetical protein
MLSVTGASQQVRLLAPQHVRQHVLTRLVQRSKQHLHIIPVLHNRSSNDQRQAAATKHPPVLLLLLLLLLQQPSSSTSTVLLKACPQLHSPCTDNAASHPEATAEPLCRCMQLLVLSSKCCQVLLQLCCQLNKRLDRCLNSSSSTSSSICTGSISSCLLVCVALCRC